MAILNLLDLTKLTNDLVAHLPQWPPIPTKLPSDIPKFEGKSGEDTSNHVMTFHLWCCSNYLLDDSIGLRILMCTLTGVATKWYIELPPTSFTTFSSITTFFLNHFQLPIRYDTSTKLLTSFRQNDSMHTSNHIHEWRRRRRIIKEEIPSRFLVDWFLKSLRPNICKDATMMGSHTEEEEILRSQQLDLIYS